MKQEAQDHFAVAIVKADTIIDHVTCLAYVLFGTSFNKMEGVKLLDIYWLRKTYEL